MSTETHDKMIAAFQEYFKWQNKFEYTGSNFAGTKSRKCLSEIKRCALTRRGEILDKQKERKAARNGKAGRPKKIHTNKL